MNNLGHTRSATQANHVLQTPDTFIRTVLPGMRDGTAIVHIAPAAGAGFTQYTAELGLSGTLGPTSAQRLLYVLEGAATLNAGRENHSLRPGSYAYIPAAHPHALIASQRARIEVIEKAYEPLAGSPAPEMNVAHEDDAAPAALMGDPDLQVRCLLPDHPSFDFAVNTMTYQPGAALGMVEVHLMEHGLLMLEGGGIYRLGACWYPVTAGDFIWMGPFCPQWFGALGKQPAKYLIYKNCNRSPLP